MEVRVMTISQKKSSEEVFDVFGGAHFSEIFRYYEIVRKYFLIINNIHATLQQVDGSTNNS